MLLDLAFYQNLHNRTDSLELLINELQRQDPAFHAYLRVVACMNETDSWRLVYGETVIAPDGIVGTSRDLDRVQVAAERLSLSDFITRVQSATKSRRLMCGRLEVGIENVFDGWSFKRQPSHQNNSSRWPCLIAEGTKKNIAHTPFPLVAKDDEEMRYYEDVYDLIQDITTFPKFHGSRDARVGTFTVLIEDRRARIIRPFRENNELVMKLDGYLPGGLVVAGKLTTKGHAPERFSHPVEAEIRLPLSDEATSVDFAIVTEAGNLVDCGGGFVSALPPSVDGDEDGIEPVNLAEQVNALLLDGECATCEFKPWVDSKLSNPKFKEITRTVVAMANTDGGHIVVGVDDSGDVKLPDGKVLGRFRGQASAKVGEAATEDERDLEAIRLYGTKIRDEIQKGVNPSVELQLRPVTLEHGSILLVFIDRGSSCHEVAESHEVLVRSNATNRRPTLEERRRLHQRSAMASS